MTIKEHKIYYLDYGGTIITYNEIELYKDEIKELQYLCIQFYLLRENRNNAIDFYIKVKEVSEKHDNIMDNNIVDEVCKIAIQQIEEFNIVSKKCTTLRDKLNSYIFDLGFAEFLCVDFEMCGVLYNE